MNVEVRRRDALRGTVRGGLAALPSYWPLLALLAVAILALPPARTASRDSADDRRIPWAYTAIVNDALAEQWLLPRPASEQGDRGEVRIGTLAPPEFATFARLSFLRGDMQSLDPSIWRWRFDNGARLEIEQRAHLIGGPFDQDPSWRGDLLFANGEELRLVEGDRTLAVLTPATLSGDTSCAELSLGSTGSSDLANERLCIQLEVDGVARTVAEIRRVGNRALLRATPSPGLVMELAGRSAARVQMFRQSWHWLEPNQTLRFSWSGGSRLFWLNQRRPPISAYRANGQRIRDSSLESFARPIEAAMGDTSASLTTTLRSDLQTVAQAELATIAGQLRSGIGSFRAAAVLMDGMSGEIAALPTFPSQIEDLHPDQVGSIREQRLVRQNGNFIRMVVGSAAKAPLAFALLNQSPALRGLEIRATSPFRTLVGLDLGTDVEDHAMPTPLNFNTFLARSSNQYASALMLLGLSDPGGFAPFRCDETTEPFRLGGRPRTCVPSRLIIRGGPGVRQPPIALGAAPVWGYQLDWLFCVAHQGALNTRIETHPGVCLPEAGRVPPIWRHPDSGRLFQRPVFLASVSPDPEAFGFNVVDDLYADYVMTILGGNRGRWTTVSLAQTYARMLTGRAVTARLLAAGDGENVPPLPAGPNLRFARQAVLQGLSDVVNEGTGRAIARAAFARPVRNGDMFRLYAKTGTPAVERNAIERARLQDFADAGCGLRLTTSAGRRSLGVGRNAGDPAASIRAATGGCRRFASSARALANEIALLNRSRDLNSIRSGPGGAVVQIPPRRSEGEGHILVLMVERYRPDTRQTCAVRVVAVNLQARVAQDKTPGIDYVNSLFRNPSTLQWLQGQPCPERRR